MNRIFKIVFLMIFSCVVSGALFPDEVKYDPPSSRFDLSGWKLQIPGPKEVKELSGYASHYFYLDAKGEMCFNLNSAEKGHTANSEYARSELRHLENWGINENKKLSAVISVDSNLSPDKVTVMQIHGITESGDNAPPLLRIALGEGNLYAFIKTDNTENKTEKVLLKKGVGVEKFECTITVADKILSVSVGGEKKFERDLSFWKYKNYFKAGCYPQAHKGTINVFIEKLEVS